MQRKLMVLFTMLVMFSLVIAPMGIVQAQTEAKSTAPDCLSYDSTLLKDQGFLHSLPPECVKTYKKLSWESNRTARVENVQGIQSMAIGGPDGFGYTYDDSVPYNWISASTNSGLTGDDEFAGPINMGFNFPFYGMPQSQLYFSTNGLITFGAGSWDYFGSDIPNDMNPNNLIAPFWFDLRVGSPYNGGAIYYSQGGSAPNRYFVVEWRNVQTYEGNTSFSFEAILHENGDIDFQYQSFPTSFWAIVGLEDSVGYDGLQQYYSSNVSNSNAIRFYYPAPSARLLVSPVERAGGFAPLNGHKDFNITISNSGTLGTDTYDLTMTANWPVTFYAANSVTPLTDTDADGVIDTGPLPQGTSTTVIARFSTPGGAQIGDNTTAVMIVKSSLNTFKTQTLVLQVSVPAEFANVFQDNTDGAMSFMTVSSLGTGTYKASVDNYFGDDVSVTKLISGNYLYAWVKYSFNASNSWTDIEYALLGPNGNIILPATKLTNNSGTTMYLSDNSPSVAIAPNGTVGVVWSHYLHNFSTSQSNYNIYFATLDASGNLLTGPTNLTNNTTWGAYGDLNVPRFYSPTIAASDDNRFILGWENDRAFMSGYVYDIWYAVRSSAGTSVFPPTALTNDGMSWAPILNSLTGGKVIMTWGTDIGKPYYSVISSNGTISTSATSLGLYADLHSSPDAVQLPNGKVALSWAADTGIGLAILDSSHNLLYGPTSAPNPYDPSSATSESLSVTTDSSSRVIMTWTGPNNRLLYALGDSAGTFVTDPMIYKTSGDYIDISWNGQGSAPYDQLPAISGNTGVPNVTLSYTDGTPKTTISKLDGSYSISVSSNWTGTVTPSHPCYTFTPPNRPYTNVLTNQTGQNYVPTFNNAPECAVTVGVYRPTNGYLYLKNSNTTGVADVQINYGVPGDKPITGDWNGDGTDTIGVYRNGVFYLRNSNTVGTADTFFAFGLPNDQPIAGDWDGNGTDTIGVYRSSNFTFYLRNSNTTGTPDLSFSLGIPGDVGIAGDWNGDGMDTTGVFRPSNGVIFLKNINLTGTADISINYGIPGDKPVIGDWNHDGKDTIGVYRNGVFYLRNSNTVGIADLYFALGIPGDLPIAGNWDGKP